MPPTPIRLLLADDHPIIHQGFAGVLFADPRIRLVGTVASFGDLLAHLAAHPVDVVALDLMGMGAGPLAMVRALRQHHPQLQLLVFSSTLALAPALVALGVLGYIAKEEVLDHLPAAIHAVAAGQAYHSPLVQAALERAAIQGQGADLAPQERAVLRLVAQGLTNPQIGDELAIDLRTAQNYVSTLYRKTGCETRAQLVAWYRQHDEGISAYLGPGA